MGHERTHGSSFKATRMRPPIQRKGLRQRPLPTQQDVSPQGPAVMPSEAPLAQAGNVLNRVVDQSTDPLAPDQVGVQAKLTVGQPNDQYEQEADRVAAQVVSSINQPSSQSVQREVDTDDEDIQRKPLESIQRSPVQPQGPRHNFLQRDGDTGIHSGPVSADFERDLNQARSGGKPLAPALQRKMGGVMGADFSGVRVHTDNRADRLNHIIQAKAFTTGQDVFFRQGAYQPESRSGQGLIAHELTHTLQQGATVQHQPEGMVQRKLVSANDNTQMVTIEEAIKFVEKQLNITENKDKDIIRDLATQYAQDNSLTTPSQLMVRAKEKINEPETNHSMNESASDTTVSDKTPESTVDSHNIDVDSSSSSTSKEHTQATDTELNNAAINSGQDNATDDKKNNGSPQDSQAIKPVTTLPSLNNYKKIFHRYAYSIGEIFYKLDEAGEDILETVGKLEPDKARQINQENELGPISAAADALGDKFASEIMPILQEEEGSPKAKRRSYAEILEPFRIECQKLFDWMIEVFENSNIDLNRYWPQSQRPDIWTSAGFLNEVERNVDEKYYESPQVPENMAHALKHMKQSVGKGACNLAASIASIIMSGSQGLRADLNSCFLGEDENGILSYRFHGQNNAISQYRGKGADSSHNQTINEILNISKKIYTVKRSDLIEGDLLPFSQPWIIYLAQAYYECEKDYGLHTQDVGKDSYELDIAIEIKENKNAERKIIYYNWIMNRVGEKFYSSYKEPTEKYKFPGRIHPNIPDDDDACKGKMFKLSEGGKHATAVVCTWDGERRFYDNESIDENTGYEDIPESFTVKQFIEDERPPSPYVFIYEIPENLSSESE